MKLVVEWFVEPTQSGGLGAIAGQAWYGQTIDTGRRSRPATLEDVASALDVPLQKLSELRESYSSSIGVAIKP
jgi:hypothetical protein